MRLRFFSSNDKPFPKGEVKDGWYLISPMGMFATADGKYIQVVNATTAKAMEADFHAKTGFADPDREDLPVFMGHPDLDRKSYPDDRRIGNIVDVQAREDGLYGKVEWNDLGQANQKQGYWRYPSPVWDYPLPTSGQRQIFPDRLASVGMTNTPNIKDSKAWNSTDELSEEEDETANSEEPNMSTKLKLADVHKHLGLPEDADPDTLMGAIKNIQSKSQEHEANCANARDVHNQVIGHLKSMRDSVTGALGTAGNDGGPITVMKTFEPANMTANSKEQVEGVKRFCDAVVGVVKQVDGARAVAANARITDYIDRAVAANCLTEAERPHWQEELGKNFDGAALKLANRQIAMNTKTVVLDPHARGEMKAGAEARDAFREGVQTLMVEKKLTYEKAWNAAEKDPRFKGHFLAMNDKAAVKVGEARRR